MKLESQVISLKLAKEMKELGFKQKSLWYWTEKNNKWVVKVTYEVYYEDYYSAYTVAELGEMQKDYKFNDWYSWYDDDDEYNKGKWRCGLILDGIGEGVRREEFVYADTEANTRAKMLIYLKKDKV